MGFEVKASEYEILVEKIKRFEETETDTDRPRERRQNRDNLNFLKPSTKNLPLVMTAAY